jgi:hypothetical protein
MDIVKTEFNAVSFSLLNNLLKALFTVRCRVNKTYEFNLDSNDSLLSSGPIFNRSFRV